MNRTALFLSLGLLASCGGSGGGSESAAGQGTLTLLATDAPFDHAIVEEARVSVDLVTAHRESLESSGFVTLYEGQERELNLFRLRNGLTQLIASGELDAGTYNQFRLRLTGGVLELKNGNVYSTADGSLKLQSQAKSGYKVFMDPAVVIEEGTDETVILDFDLTKTFHPVPGNDPEMAREYKLHPNIRASVTSVSGELRGKILGSPDPEDVVVHVLPPGETDPVQGIATTATDEDGSAAFLGLEPGLYDVMAFQGTLSGVAHSVAVEAGGLAAFEIVLE